MNSDADNSPKSDSEDELAIPPKEPEKIRKVYQNTNCSVIYLPGDSKYVSLNGKRKQQFEAESKNIKVLQPEEDTNSLDNIMIPMNEPEDINLVDPLSNETNFMDHDYFNQGTPLEDPVYIDAGSPTTSIGSSKSKITREEDDVFIQEDTCLETADYLPLCRECSRSKRTNKYCCRFYEFRKLKNNNGILSVNGFLDPHLDPNDYDLKLWEQMSPEQENLRLDTESIKYLLTYIATQFCELIWEEHDAKQQHLSDDQIIAWKRSVPGVREMCDVCETSLFNNHWTCQQCGFSVCLDCYKDRKNFFIRIRAVDNEDRKLRDQFFWYKCTNKEDHDIRELMLTQIIAGDALDLMNKRLHEICQQWNITQSCGCKLNTNCIKKESTSMLHDYMSTYNVHGQVEDDLYKEVKRRKKLDAILSERKGINPGESKVLYNHVAHEWMCDGKVLRFMNPLETDDAYKMFQDQWERGSPILISNCTEKIRKDIWHPQVFLASSGHKKNVLVDCITSEMIQNQPMLKFWEGFMEIRQRLRDKKTNNPLILKLKDWPPTDDFAEIIPDHFNDLKTCLPLPAYTSRNGKFNLASHLPTHFVKPDLGPKMYSAYGQATHNATGSTNLHLDISDAINVMVYVSVPTDVDSNLEDVSATEGYKFSSIVNAINDANCDYHSRRRFQEERLKNRSDKTKKLPGAFWHIYDSKDADKIRELLNSIAKEEGKAPEANSDPIHDQSTYLNKAFRDRLFKDYGVKGCSFIQFDGDAVFIPAGAPHQVRNINDCIKVAEDFVSPENIAQCFNLTEEFRDLSETHTNHEDKLQVKNLLYHTVKNILSHFEIPGENSR